ncbi:hypothetical protein BGW36DRAFT_355793 [Talaromyces proteolyticus]|uniref:GPI anchored protein n=1 Tax=Talaromyces proteolyticus TaxID=1131652 RepID=A0AAD4L0J3_9EURO|nr:uncharacterized protein BGW36DRAFT_355793 [Talaromyces proteolyticus]KAH8701640.1 hypothetical protein BGW36DRAFT_355793 [Talaromyces proteolyticus]
MYAHSHFLVFSFLSYVAVVLGSSVNIRDVLHSARAGRTLLAANPRVQLERRSQISLLDKEAVFHYLHSSEEDSVYEASLFVKAAEPILVLEHLEDDLAHVECSTSDISLSFASAEVLTVLKRLSEVTNFVVVTSHVTCNDDGERATYRAKKAIVDSESHMVRIPISPCQWHDAFVDTRVSFSRRHVEENKLQRRTFQKRQDGATTAPASATTTEVQIQGPTPMYSFPTTQLSASAAVATATHVLNVSLINQQIFPPSNPVADQVMQVAWCIRCCIYADCSRPQNIKVNCQNCTIGGTVEIGEANFNIPNNGSVANLIGDFNNAIAFFKNGSIEMDASGLAAHLEFKVDIEESHAVFPTLNISLPSIGLSPFEIPGVAVFGPLIQPDVLVAVSLAEQLSFTYGMDVTVPDHSKLHINISAIENSTMVGFTNTTVKPIPLQASTPLTSLVMSVSFQPQLLLGVTSLAGSVTGGIGGFLSLPTLSVNITELKNVDTNCNSVSDANSTNSAGFTNIVPSIDLNVGAIAKLQASIEDFNKQVTAQLVIAQTAFALPTKCMAYDSAAQTYGIATIKATATASGTSTGNGKAGGQSGMGGIIRERDSLWLRRVAGLAAILVTAGFLGWA